MLMASFSLLLPGLIAGDKISPVEDGVSGREGESVTLTCQYETKSRMFTLTGTDIILTFRHLSLYSGKEQDLNLNIFLINGINLRHQQQKLT